MTKLSKYTLEYNEQKERWDLTKDKTDTVVKTFGKKETATSGGLRRAVGDEGGSVKIQKMSGGYQEERTYPRSRDPRTSKG
jgi:hypothetical protein